MQLDWDEQFDCIVLPAWEAYLLSEAKLTDAVTQGDVYAVRSAEYEALREGGAASFYVHHYGEVVLRARPYWLPPNISTPYALAKWLNEYCLMMRTEKHCRDVFLLRDVTDSLKHSVLTHRLKERQISANEAVLVAASGYGELGFGEGKYGGVNEVLVLAVTGTRALSCVIQNVIDAWQRVMGRPLGVIGR